MADFSGWKDWDAVADNYAAWTLQHLEPYSARVLELASLQPDHHVVDVACGPGTLTALAADRVASVQAVDFSPRMVEHCQARVGGNVEVQVADGHALPFDDDSFDAAFSMFGLAFFADRVKALGELRRVLKPGAAAWVSTWVTFDKSPALSRLGPVMRILDPDLSPPEGVPMNNEAAIRADFEAAGFTVVEVHPLPGTLHIDDVDAMWDRLVAGNIFIRHLRGQIGEDAFAEREPAAKAKFGEGLEAGQRLSQPALLGMGRT